MVKAGIKINVASFSKIQHSTNGEKCGSSTKVLQNRALNWSWFFLSLTKWSRNPGLLISWCGTASVFPLNRSSPNDDGKGDCHINVDETAFAQKCCVYISPRHLSKRWGSILKAGSLQNSAWGLRQVEPVMVFLSLSSQNYSLNWFLNSSSLISGGDFAGLQPSQNEDWLEWCCDFNKRDQAASLVKNNNRA